jgi:hypothetical protein
MSDHSQEAKKPIDLHLGNAPAFVAFALKRPKCIVLTQDENGAISMNSHGVESTAVLNEMLSVGIYCALRAHYDDMRNGVGGEELQERQANIDEANREGAAL